MIADISRNYTKIDDTAKRAVVAPQGASLTCFFGQFFGRKNHKGKTPGAGQSVNLEQSRMRRAIH
jgi:hypothetical protein